MDIPVFPVLSLLALCPVITARVFTEVTVRIPIRNAVHPVARGIQNRPGNQRRVSELGKHFFFAPPFCNLSFNITAIIVHIFRDQTLCALLSEAQCQFV